MERFKGRRRGREDDEEAGGGGGAGRAAKYLQRVRSKRGVRGDDINNYN